MGSSRRVVLSWKRKEEERTGLILACFLLLNSDKRLGLGLEVLILGPKHLRVTLSNDIAVLDDIALASNETVRNLGVIFFHLRNISKIWNVLTQKDAEKLVHAFVTSRLDYCNSLLSGSSRKSLKNVLSAFYYTCRPNCSWQIPGPNSPFLWTRYLENALRESLHIWCKCSVGLKDEWIRFQWWKVPVNVMWNT